MSVSALALVLILAPSPEELWARIVDPAIPAEERMEAVEVARDVLPPEYIPKLVAARLAEQESRTPRPELRDALERVVIFDLERMLAHMHPRGSEQPFPPRRSSRSRTASRTNRSTTGASACSSTTPCGCWRRWTTRRSPGTCGSRTAASPR